MDTHTDITHPGRCRTGRQICSSRSGPGGTAAPLGWTAAAAAWTGSRLRWGSWAWWGRCAARCRRTSTCGPSACRTGRRWRRHRGSTGSKLQEKKKKNVNGWEDRGGRLLALWNTDGGRSQMTPKWKVWSSQCSFTHNAFITKVKCSYLCPVWIFFFYAIVKSGCELFHLFSIKRIYTRWWFHCAGERKHLAQQRLISKETNIGSMWGN